jgi:hypothetical protein
MSLQTIINNASEIRFLRRKVAAQTVSRSGRVLNAEIARAQPFQFQVSFPEGLRFSTNRALTESVDSLDIIQVSTIDIGNSNPRLNYITSYQGDISSAQLNNITCVSSSGSNLVINTSSVTGSGVLFKPGDLIQPVGHLYPYTVTAQVNFSASGSLTIPLHRPFLAQTGFTLAGAGLKTGSAVTWQVRQASKPTYSVVPHDRLSFNSDFVLVEAIL